MLAYPRSRGATVTVEIYGDSITGLSPLARGNLLDPLAIAAGAGPIPARAGQPAGAACPGQASGAYPRSRGATVVAVGAAIATYGLSPLARGNRQLAPLLGGLLGPIPARAGQPSPSPGCKR